MSEYSRIYKLVVVSLITAGAFLAVAHAQPLRQGSAAEIQQNIKKLSVLGSVLYLAAHPDDENTTVLAYLANERLYRTAYLSLTRGDGGQNLIGSEKGPALGIIRTRELLAARQIDGAEQFFSRAIDFGYSKSAAEALSIWGKESILRDVVYVIRKFRPDVIITRFLPDRGGHGHHLASAILAREGFEAAADPNRFSDQLSEVGTWQATRLVWDAFSRGSGPEESKGFDEATTINIGKYNPLLGKSYTEIAALSRSQHKSQGFGASGSRGERFARFLHTAGMPAHTDLFDNIDSQWSRIPGTDKIAAMITEIQDIYQADHPETVVPMLAELHKTLTAAGDEPWMRIKAAEVVHLIQQCLGLWFEAISDSYTFTPGSTVPLTIQAVNRSGQEVRLEKYRIGRQPAVTVEKVLTENNLFQDKNSLQLSGEDHFSTPYWLKSEPQIGSFTLQDSLSRGLPFAAVRQSVRFHFTIAGAYFEYRVPVLYRWTDLVQGERYRRLEIIPPVTLEHLEKNMVFADLKPQKISIGINSNDSGKNSGPSTTAGTLHVVAPEEWQVRPEKVDFNFSGDNQSISKTLEIIPPPAQSVGKLQFWVEIAGESRKPAYQLRRISYAHIPEEHLLVQAEIQAIKINLKSIPRQIGYIQGSGDEVPEALTRLGYPVSPLDAGQLNSTEFSKYDVIILGVRALNTRQDLVDNFETLMKYVHEGGRVIVQYNVAHNLLTEKLGPYPIRLSRDRVTDEFAPVTILQADHPLLNAPNRIGPADFEGWVQERGLYFPGEWDERYVPLLSMADPGEAESRGSLLYTRYGKGDFIYSGISWFRQLPAGVPGAYRIFVNLVSGK